MFTVTNALIVLLLILVAYFVWKSQQTEKFAQGLGIDTIRPVESDTARHQLAQIGGGFSNTLQRRLGMEGAADGPSEQFSTFRSKTNIADNTMFGGFMHGSVLPV